MEPECQSHSTENRRNTTASPNQSKNQINKIHIDQLQNKELLKVS